VEAVILYPAIDLKDGVCVRLKRGDMNAATVFNTDPAAQARAFAQAGCQWLHVVDLDGAIEGRSVNGPAVDAIIAAVKIPVQLGGGIRDMVAIEFWLGRGVARVILGTAALRDPALVHEACRKFPNKVAVGIDARNGLVAVSGWTETSQMTAIELAMQFENAGVAAIIHTDIDRDGVLGGPNTAATAALADALDIPVIVSGGVSSLDDLAAIKARSESGIAGAIVGRALYDGRIDLRAALAVLEA
jgi:phosphoribosylformimino-5-aminoimidazole carboxamide ribotide isomerase